MFFLFLGEYKNIKERFKKNIWLKVKMINIRGKRGQGGLPETFPGWVIAIILIALLGVAIYYVYSYISKQAGTTLPVSLDVARQQCDLHCNTNLISTYCIGEKVVEIYDKEYVGTCYFLEDKLGLSRECKEINLGNQCKNYKISLKQAHKICSSKGVKEDKSLFCEKRLYVEIKPSEFNENTGSLKINENDLVNISNGVTCVNLDDAKNIPSEVWPEIITSEEENNGKHPCRPKPNKN